MKKKTTTSKKNAHQATISLEAPGAHEVYVAGSFNDWQPNALPMAKQKKDGAWCVELTLPPGHYEYKFVVDGIWCCDVRGAQPIEQAEACVPNEFGTMNRVLEIEN